METNRENASRGKALRRAPKGLRRKLEWMLTGIEGLLAEDSPLPSPDGPISKADMVARLAAGVARYEAIDTHLLALQQARKALLEEGVALQQSYNDCKDALRAVIGRRSPRIAHFGLTPEQPRAELTPEQRVIRAEKARQTRLLRHTGGKRQKAAIRYRGEVAVTAELSETTAMPETPETSPPPNDLPASQESS
jgi:hypothetical protein